MRITMYEKRSDTRRFQDLEIHFQEAHSAYLEIENGNLSAYKRLLSNLRSLICDDKKQRNRGLLLYFIEKYTQQKYLVVSTPGALRQEQSTLQEFLNEKMQVAEKEITKVDFIYEFASQDASHADARMTPFLKEGESLLVFGFPVHIQAAMSVAAPVLDICNSAIKNIRPLIR